jgi:hypothetical protein
VGASQPSFLSFCQACALSGGAYAFLIPSSFCQCLLRLFRIYAYDCLPWFELEHTRPCVIHPSIHSLVRSSVCYIIPLPPLTPRSPTHVRIRSPKSAPTPNHRALPAYSSCSCTAPLCLCLLFLVGAGADTDAGSWFCVDAGTETGSVSVCLWAYSHKFRPIALLSNSYSSSDPNPTQTPNSNSTLYALDLDVTTHRTIPAVFCLLSFVFCTLWTWILLHRDLAGGSGEIFSVGADRAWFWFWFPTLAYSRPCHGV